VRLLPRLRSDGPSRPAGRVDHRHLVDDERVDRVEQLAQLAVWSMSWSAMTPIGSRNSEWMVWPPTLSAATPWARRSASCFGGVPGEVLEQRRLAGAGPAGDEDVLPGVSIAANTAACSGDSSGSDTSTL
jgi:hypothetical protein